MTNNENGNIYVEPENNGQNTSSENNGQNTAPGNNGQNTSGGFCTHCGAPLTPGADFCAKCGTPVKKVQPAYAPKSKMAAGLLGIFLGGWGVHNFYLGNTQRAVVQLVLTIVTCGAASLWGFIEGILILCGNISTDANGVPLSE